MERSAFDRAGVWVAVTSAVTLAGCARSSETLPPGEGPSPPGQDDAPELGEARIALQLKPAEPALCDGAGTKKEQSPDGAPRATGHSSPGTYGFTGISALPLLGLPSSAAFCAGVEVKPKTFHLSADDSASTASPVLVRELIERGDDVPLSVIRSWEFLNYYDAPFAHPQSGVKLVPQLSSCPTEGSFSFQVGVVSEAMTRDTRPPFVLTFVLDTSGSMAGKPFDLASRAIDAAISQLRQGDVVSMVTWSAGQRELLAGHVIESVDDVAVAEAIASFTIGGGTDLNGGLRRGYELAKEHYDPEALNRVILISDGVANLGVVEEDLIGRHASERENEEIYLTGVGVGVGMNDTLMDTVTEAGRGAYVYLDTLAEADKMLGDRFIQVVGMAARQIRLEMTLPWYMRVDEFYGEQISENPDEVRRQNLGPNDASVFFHRLSSCDPTAPSGSDEIVLEATYKTVFGAEPRRVSVRATLNELAGEHAALLKSAAVAGYVDTLESVWSPPFDIGSMQKRFKDAHGAVASARAVTPDDPDLDEIDALLTTFGSRWGI